MGAVGEALRAVGGGGGRKGFGLWIFFGEGDGKGIEWGQCGRSAEGAVAKH